MTFSGECPILMAPLSARIITSTHSSTSSGSASTSSISSRICANTPAVRGPGPQQSPYSGPPQYSATTQQNYRQLAEHPKSTTILILGILGVVLCSVCAPFAWVMGNSAKREVEAGMYAPSASLTWGRILGIVGTVFMVFGFLLLILFLILGVIGSSSSTATYDTMMISSFLR